MSIKQLWLKIPEKVRKEIHSFVQTFLTVAFLEMSIAIEKGIPMADHAALIALLVAIARTAFKSAYNSILLGKNEPKQ